MNLAQVGCAVNVLFFTVKTVEIIHVIAIYDFVNLSLGYSLNGVNPLSSTLTVSIPYGRSVRVILSGLSCMTSCLKSKYTKKSDFRGVSDGEF